MRLCSSDSLTASHWLLMMTPHTLVTRRAKRCRDYDRGPGRARQVGAVTWQAAIGCPAGRQLDCSGTWLKHTEREIPPYSRVRALCRKPQHVIEPPRRICFCNASLCCVLSVTEPLCSSVNVPKTITWNQLISVKSLIGGRTRHSVQRLFVWEEASPSDRARRLLWRCSSDHALLNLWCVRAGISSAPFIPQNLSKIPTRSRFIK